MGAHSARSLAPRSAARPLLQLGLKDSPLYMINGVIFVLSWLLIRVLFAMPAATYLIATQWASLEHLPAWRLYPYAGCFGVGAVLNVIWSHKLFSGALKLLREGEHAKEA